ncbi:MAG: Gfo/Idh/MocA family oxidoreductase [Syntrophomonas sp.]
MIKCGFIGFGRMGITHFSILNTHPSVDVVAVCDSSDIMMKILKQYCTKVRTYTDYKRMMDEEKLDCVIISTPTDSHADVINAAVQRNIHVFVEKPFTMTPEEGVSILNSIEGKRLVTQVGYVNRFNEVFMEVKELINSGVIGDIKNFSSEMYGATVLKDTTSSWRSKKKTGGGCMYEFASHCIDLAIYLFGQPDKVVGSVLQSVFSSDVEDIVSSNFIYDEGRAGLINVNWSDQAYRKPANIVKVFGTRGKIVADKHAYKIYMRQANEKYGFETGWNTRYITDFAKSVRFYVRGNEFTRQLDYFVDCIEKSNFKNISSFSAAQKTDIIMDEITKDASITLSKIKLTNTGSDGSPLMKKTAKRSSIWSKFSKQEVESVR